MASGNKAIVPNGQDTAVVLRDECLGRPGEAAHAVESFAKKMGEIGRAQVLQKYNLSNHIAALLKSYQEVL